MVPVFITAAIIGAVHRFLRRHVLPKARSTELGAELYWSPTLRVFVCAGLGLVLALLAFFFVWLPLTFNRPGDAGPQTSDITFAATASIVLLTTAVAIIRTCFARLEFDNKGVTVRSPLRLQQRFLWADFVSYSYSELLTAHKFRTSRGSGVRIPIFMCGLDDFLAMLSAQNPLMELDATRAKERQLLALTELGG